MSPNKKEKRKKLKFTPGKEWRLSCKTGEIERFAVENLGVFDELVVDGWFHMEQMCDNVWSVRVGGTFMMVTIHAPGQYTVKTVCTVGRD